jgi:hypothetical protein
MGFPTSVNVTQAPAVEGDFASANPRHSVLSEAGGFVAGDDGLIIGRFAWIASDGVTLNNTAESGAPDCFVHRDLQALITTYLAEHSMTIPAGFGIGEVYDGGDFWAKNTASSGTVSRGQKAFAKLADGSVQFAAAGATVSNYVETNFYAATGGGAGDLIKITDKAQ